MEIASTYIPMDRRQALARGESLADRVRGAALFIDISGFTPLTEALERALGPRRGAEELTRCLNRVYDALIAEVDRRGGSVIGFAGDSFTCWFDGDDGRRAVACGLAMQVALRAFAAVRVPSGETVALAGKVAVAVGSARRFVVGDPEIQYVDVLAGATLQHMAAGEHLTEKGEVVLDQGFDPAVAKALRIAEWRVDPETGRRCAVVGELAQPVPETPWPVLPGDALPEEQTRPWLLPPVYERLHSGQDTFLAELRPTVPLFLSFTGIDYDGDGDAPQRLDAYIRWVQQVLIRYGGYLIQITIGDKGSYLYASFGALVAHDDDAARAVAAALELQALPSEFDYIKDIRIGVAAGRTYCGAVGGTTAHQYGVMADPVNLSARLMQAAPPGGILVSEAAQKLAARGFAWESLPALKVKGKSAPVAVFRPAVSPVRRVPRVQEPRYAIPLVGREAELEVIERAMQDVLSGQGRTVALVADAGMGKSRLVAETIRRAAARQLDAYIGESQSYGTHNSYHAWHSVWRAFFGMDEVESAEEQMRILEAHLAAIDPALLPRLPLLGVALNIPIPDNDLTHSLDGQLRKASLEGLLVDCLRARARTTPLLLVLEDAHWLDPLSRDLLETVGRGVADLPVLLVVAYRPAEPAQREAVQLARLPGYVLVELTSFTPLEAARLMALKLRQLTGESAPPPEHLVQRITARAQGNPFYIEELLNYLRDCGLDPRDARALEQLELPASLHSLILSRIDQLGESQKITIKVASVIGRQFRMAWLRGAHPQIGTPTQVQVDLDALSRLDLTPLDQPEPERIYLFKHIVTREVAYESLPFATRSLLHGQLGQFIEQCYADTLDQYVDLLAYHFDLSEIEPKKREYLRKAGEAAQASFANEAAITYYRRLLPLLPRAECGPVMLRLGQVLELVGEWDEAADLYERALRLADQMEDQRGEAAARRAMGWLLRKRGEYQQAATWLTKARAGFERVGDLAAVSRVMTDIGEVARQLGAYTEARKWYDDALNLAASVEERVPRMMAQAQALKEAGTLAAKQGDYTASRALYEESLAIRQELDDRPAVAVLLNNLGVVARYLEDYAAARTLNEESLAVFREIGDGYSAGKLLNNLGCVAADRKDYAAARQLLTESLELRRRLGDQSGLAFSLNSLGDVLLDEGDHRAAHPLLAESMAINQALGDRVAMAYLLEDFAVLAAAEDQPERAVRLAAAAAAAHELLGAQLASGERARFDRLQAPARAALDEQQARTAWEEGWSMTLDQAVTYALHGETLSSSTVALGSALSATSDRWSQPAWSRR